MGDWENWRRQRRLAVLQVAHEKEKDEEVLIEIEKGLKSIDSVFKT